MRKSNQDGKIADQSPAPLRCAIYTRKSTEEGLDQEFNSLDAQREAAEAFIQSQRREGWIVLRELYDDGGFTGANTDRPTNLHPVPSRCNHHERGGDRMSMNPEVTYGVDFCAGGKGRRNRKALSPPQLPSEVPTASSWISRIARLMALASHLELPMSAEPKIVATSVSACWLTACLPGSRELARYRQLPNSPTPRGITMTPLSAANFTTSVSPFR